MAVLSGCPCGEVHEVGGDVLAQFERVTAGLSGTVPVTVPGLGTWRVDRVFFVCHGLLGADLPVVAEQYGFRQEP